MNNELIRVEEKQLIIAQKAITNIKQLEKSSKLIEEQMKKFKDQLKEIMKDNGILSYESPDKTLKVSRTCDSSSISFDTKAFEKDHPDLYKKYLTKETKKQGSIRITNREENKNDNRRKII